MNSTYTITVKFAPPGTFYFNEKSQKLESSTWGHVWLEARKPGESLSEKPSFSSGWSTGESIFLGGEDNLSNRDWFRYRGSNISSITVAISKEQYEKLESYPKLAANGKILGFNMNYDGPTNSCIDFAGLGLGYIGLAEQDFDGKAREWKNPDRQLEAFLQQIAQHRAPDAALEVRHHGQIYRFQPHERDLEQINKQIDLSLNLHLEFSKNFPRYAQITPTLTIDNIPDKARALYTQTEERMRAFYTEFDIPYQEHELRNAAAALAAAAYSNNLPEVHDFELHNGKMVAFWEHRNGAYKDVLLDADRANNSPQQESFAQMIEAEPKLAEAARQRAMEIAAYEQSQSMGRSM